MLKQPINQVRLTNVAVMRLKKGGKRFEIACYKNKILNWRDRTETDVSEVLQTDAIFTNVSKGQLAKVQDLQRLFGTKDALAIARLIMDHGEFQVSEKERTISIHQVFHDVCTSVTDRVFNRVTGLSIPITLIESTLTRLGFSVSMDVAPKRQSLKAIELLCSQLPDQVARTQMLLRLTGRQAQRNQIRGALIHQPYVYIVKEHPEMVRQHQHQPQEEQQQRQHQTRHSRINTTSSLPPDVSSTSFPDANTVRDAPPEEHPEDEGDYVITFYCDPTYYRDIDHFTTQQLVPTGTLQILSTKECFINPNAVPPPLSSTSNPNPPCSTQHDTPEAVHPSLALDAAVVDSRISLSSHPPPPSYPVLSSSSSQRTVVPAQRENDSPNTAGCSTINETSSLLPSVDHGHSNEESTVLEGPSLGGGSVPPSSCSPAGGTPEGASSSQATSCLNPTQHFSSIPCRTCEKQLESIAVYRSHCKTGWHQFNVKRRFRKLPPVTHAEYEDLAEDITRGFLAVA